jgi:PcfJ-like protein
VPRFLASAWLGALTEPRAWFVAHTRGRRFRSLALPVAMTRRMEDIFLRTPDHLGVYAALRRAEVLALGGSEQLAGAILATRLVEDFSDAERWRAALGWLARCDSLDLAQLRPIVDFLHENAIDLRGRTFASVMRLVRTWHGSLATARMWARSWPRSRWNEMAVAVEPKPGEQHRAEWRIVELLDSGELAYEGRAMRHCVATYAPACASRRCSIWSLRYRSSDASAPRSMLTIEVDVRRAAIVQVRGAANSRPRPFPRTLVERWAAREHLVF